MEYLLTALELSGCVAGNAILVWVTYIPLFIIAIFAHKGAEGSRRKASNVMLGTSVPGLLMVASCLCICIILFVKAFTVLKANQSTEYYSFDDLYKMLQNFEGWGLAFTLLTFLVAGIQCVIFIICGAVIIKSGTGRLIGWISVIVSILLIIGGCLFVGPFCLAIGY